MSSIEHKPGISGGQRSIEAAQFQPSSDTRAGFRISLPQALLLLAAALTLFVFWFLFTSKSVAISFTPAAADVSIEGGFSFELADVYLLREGQYTVSATAPLHQPINTDLEVGSARNQSIELNFTPLPGFLELNLALC